MSNMVVRTNVFALNAHRNMKNVGLEQGRASNRLASGYRINSAADDAAGLAISETMRAQIRGLDQASRNAQDAQALIQTAEGGMNEITNMIQRIRELTVQAANDTNVTVNRQQIALEINQLLSEIDSMAARVQFNTRTLIQGHHDTSGAARGSAELGGTVGVVPGAEEGALVEGGTTLHFQIGANAGQSILVSIGSVTSSSLGLIGVGGVWAQTEVDAEGSHNTLAAEISANLTIIQNALDTVSLTRARLGAVSNRLDYTMRSIDISSENLSDAESRVRNADMAREMMRFTMSNVLQQASVSMLAQANQLPNNLLQLLR